MAIGSYRLGHSVGGKLILGTNPYYPNVDWTEGSGNTQLDVLMTAGEYSTARTSYFQNMAAIGAITDSSSRVKVLLADGVESLTGTMSFDCDKSYITSLLSWILNNRKESFTSYIGTEQFSYVKIPSCRWNSFTLSTGEGSVLNCSLGFMSNVKGELFHPTSTGQFNEIYKNSDMVPYWHTGIIEGTEVLKTISWEMSVSQNIIPQYLNNEDFDLPAYFRTTIWDFNFTVQMLTELQDYEEVQMAVNSAFNPLIMTLDNYIQTSTSISYGGLDAMGNYQISATLAGVPVNYSDSASEQVPYSVNFS